MALAISLAAYSLKIWNLEKRKDDVVSSFAPKAVNGGKSTSSDLLVVITEHLQALKKSMSDHKDSQHVLAVKKLAQDDRRVFGVIETGEYGVESDLLSVETKTVAYHRKATEADMRPFYFLLEVPEGTDEAILLLQRSGTLGIRKVIQLSIAPRFIQLFPMHRLKIEPLVDTEDIRKYMKGQVESIRFTRFGIPSDFAEAYDAGHKEVEGSVELVIKARRGKSLPINNRLQQLLTGKKTVANFIALHDTNFEYDSVKIKTKVGKSHRTIDLADPSRIRSYHDISGEVELGKGGHPKFESIHVLATNLLEKISGKLSVKVVTKS